MKIVEYQQRAEDGGFPNPNENGFLHGEAVLCVKKAEFSNLIDKAYLVISSATPAIAHYAYGPIRELNEILVELGRIQVQLKHLYWESLKRQP